MKGKVQSIFHGRNFIHIIVAEYMPRQWWFRASNQAPPVSSHPFCHIFFLVLIVHDFSCPGGSWLQLYAQGSHVFSAGLCSESVPNVWLCCHPKCAVPLPSLAAAGGICWARLGIFMAKILQRPHVSICPLLWRAQITEHSSQLTNVIYYKLLHPRWQYITIQI